MIKHKILIIEDDKEINKLLQNVLENNGYEVKCAYNGLDGLNVLKQEVFQMLLLDLMLPFKSGDSIVSELRRFSQIPIIVISAKDLTQTKVDLLRIGADDYITKPFDIDEVIARVESNLRRYQMLNSQKSNKLYKYKDITLNTETKEVVVNKTALLLTAKEYKIIELMLQNQIKVFSKNNLFESVWGEEYISDENTLNVHMSNLRNKLKLANPNESYIETVWGMGYRLYKN